jgi:hypothetical protein
MSLLGQYEYVLDKTHAKANEEGAVYLHIKIAEKLLGRKLKPLEVVHHKDLNKLNNDISNLMVFSTKADHSSFHHQNCDESLLIQNDDGAFSCKRQINYCVDCNSIIDRKATRCKECNSIHSRKVVRPSKDSLKELIENYNGNFTQLSKKLGVSDNAIRKWCKYYNIPSKSSAYK